MKKITSITITLLLLLLLLVGLTLTTAQDSRDVIVATDDGETEYRDERLAIVVGINDYATITPLNYAVQDAGAIRDILVEKGNFTVEYYADDGLKPNKDNIMNAVSNANRAARNGWIKTFVLYFAGHGFEDNGEHYLATVGTHKSYLSETAISLNEMLNTINDIQENAKVMVFLDACRNDISKRGGGDSWNSDIDSHGLGILRSASSGQYSYEIDELEHGIYTYYLLQGLEGDGDRDDDGYVSFSELARYVMNSMRDWSQTNDEGLIQTPTSDVKNQTGEFFITKTNLKTVEYETEGTLVSRPTYITGTVINERPIVYERGTPGGTFLSYDLGDPKTWNDSQSTDATSSSMISRFQPSLMDINYDIGRWTVSLGDHSKGDEGPGYDLIVDEEDNTMEIVIYLRNDIYWSDNTRMTADDWVFYWNEIQGNQDIRHNGFNTTRVYVDGEEMAIVAEKMDQFTFKYVYPIPIGDPELPISGGIMPMHIIRPIYETEGAVGIRQFWGIDTPVTELVGYGPWLVDSFEQGQNTIFVKNDNYFNRDEWNVQLPYLDSYVSNVVANQNTALLKFQGGELSAVGFRNIDFNNVVGGAEEGGYSVWNGGPGTGILFATFNENPNSDRMKGTPQLEWFTNTTFRQAMNYLIDKEYIIQTVLNGLGEPDKGNLHPASPYFNPENTFPNEYNPTRALSMLEEELNMRDRNGDGIIEDRNGVDVSFEILTNEGNNERIQVMNIIANGWTANGVRALANTIDFNNLVQKLIANYDWESMVIGLTGGIWPSAGANVWRSSANLHFWHPFQDSPATEWEAEIDDLFEMARNEPDFDTRKDLWDDMYAVLYEQVPYFLIYRRYSFQAIYNEWQNVNWDVMAGVGGNYNQYLFKR